MEEVWKAAIGYEGRYEVSSLGRVRSLTRIQPTSKGQRRVNGCIITQRPNVDGYPHVPLRIDGKLRLVTVHRLVCRAFHGAPNLLHREVAHLDNDRSNARADNLVWVSHRENASHKRHHGTHQAGEMHPRAKLTRNQALEIRRRYRAGERPSLIAADFGVATRTASDIGHGRRWKHLDQLSRCAG